MNFEQAIVICISSLWFTCRITEMEKLANSFKPVFCHDVLYSCISHKGVRGPVHGNTWETVYVHEDAPTKICLQFLVCNILPLVEQCWFVYQLLPGVSISFVDYKIHSLVFK